MSELPATYTAVNATSDFFPKIDVIEGTPKTSSRAIAECFGKEHKHVMRDIKALQVSDSFRLSNFGLSQAPDAQGINRPMYWLTKDGFTILAMGYTGQKAMQFKEAYIAAFNAMAERLAVPATTSQPQIDVQSLVAYQAQLISGQQKLIDRLEQHQPTTKQPPSETYTAVPPYESWLKNYPEGEYNLREVYEEFEKKFKLGWKQTRFTIMLKKLRTVKKRHSNGQQIIQLGGELV